MSYFTTLDEALHLAASPDGHRFEVLNGGAPLLHSTVGTRTPNRSKPKLNSPVSLSGGVAPQGGGTWS